MLLLDLTDNNDWGVVIPVSNIDYIEHIEREDNDAYQRCDTRIYLKTGSCVDVRESMKTICAMCGGK